MKKKKWWGCVSEVWVLCVEVEGCADASQEKPCFGTESAVVEPDHHGGERQRLKGVVGVEHIGPARVWLVAQTEHQTEEANTEGERRACFRDACRALCSPALQQLGNHTIQCSQWFDDVRVCCVMGSNDGYERENVTERKTNV